MPPANFEFLVLSIAMQAQMALGLFTTEEQQVPRDLNVARHVIDLLAVLQEKTKGNLTMEEQRTLDNTLTELRFRYLQAVEDEKKKPAETPKAEETPKVDEPASEKPDPQEAGTNG